MGQKLEVLGQKKSKDHELGMNSDTEWGQGRSKHILYHIILQAFVLKGTEI